MIDTIPEGPAWAAVGTLAAALAFVTREAVKNLRARTSNANGTSGRVSLLIEQIEKNAVLQTTAVQALATSVALLTQRIEGLPTAADLSREFERSRHDMRNIIAPLLAR